MRDIKRKAKEGLKGNYYRFFLISLFTAIASIYIKPVLVNTIYRVTFHISYIMVIINLFVMPQIVTGVKKVYLSGDFKYLFKFVKKELYLKSIVMFFIKTLIIFTLTTFFIIPGIYIAIKMIFVPYIFADNSDMDIKSIFSKSFELTKGKNMQIFKLILSFSGWYLLGIFTLGIGVLFVNPYFEMTLKELYIKFKEEK